MEDRGMNSYKHPLEPLALDPDPTPDDPASLELLSRALALRNAPIAA